MFHRNGITTVSVAMVFIAGLLGSAPPASAASIPAGPDGPTPFDPTQNVPISTPDGSPRHAKIPWRLPGVEELHVDHSPEQNSRGFLGRI